MGSARRSAAGSVKYLWGDAEPDERKANYCWHQDSPNGLFPVGLFPEGATPDGLQDMAGNVREWTASEHEYDGNRKSLRGGGWDSPLSGLVVYNRDSLPPELPSNSAGFRCVREGASQ